MKTATTRGVAAESVGTCALAGAAILIAAILCFSNSAAALSLTWDVASGDGATITDGSGNWNNGGGNWNDGTTDATWNNSNPDSAVIGGGTLGSAGTITLTSGITTGGITFNAPNGGGNYLITGNTLTMANGSTIVLNAPGTSTIASTMIVAGAGNTVTVSGAGDLTLGGQVGNGTQVHLIMGGSGTLTLAGTTDNNGTIADVNSGATLILAKTSSGGVHSLGSGGTGLTINNGGTVVLGGSGGDQIYTQLDVVNNGTFDMAGLSEGFDGLTGSGSFINTGVPGELTVGQAGTSGSFTGTFANNMGLGVSGGTLTVSNAPSLMWLSGGGTLTYTGAPGTLTLDLQNQQVGTHTFSGTINGDLQVVIANSSRKNTDLQTFSGTNNYTGGTLIDNGHLRITSDVGLGAVPGSFDPDNIILQNGGVLQNNDSDPVLDANRGITLGGGNGVFYVGWSKTMTVQGVITGAGNLVKTDSGTLILTGANDYTGTTTVSGGILQIGNGGTSGTIGSGNVTLGGQLHYSRTDALTLNNKISSGMIVVNSGTLTLAGTADNNSAVATVNNGATLVLGKASTGGIHSLGSGGTGLTINNGGQVVLGGSGNDQIYYQLDVVNNGTFDMAGFSEGFDGLTGSGSFINTGGPSELTVGQNGASGNFSGTFANNMGLGVSGGTLTVSNAPSLMWLSGGGTLTYTGTPATLTLDLDNAQVGGHTFSGTINGDLQVVIADSSRKNTDVQVFSGTNAYNGGTVIDNGHLRISADGGLGAVPTSFDFDNVVLKNGGVLQNNNSSPTLDANRGIYLENGDGIIYVGWGGGQTMTVNGVISGTGRLIKRDSGVLLLNGENTFTGDTRAEGYVLRIGNTLALQNSTVDASAGNNIDLNNLDVVLGGLKNGGTNFQNFTGHLSVGNNNQDTTFTGALSGTGSLEKIGTGTLTLSGGNSYGGGTTITTGILKAGANNVLPYGAGKGDVTVNARLDLGGYTVNLNGLNGSGTVDPTFRTSRFDFLRISRRRGVRGHSGWMVRLTV